MVLTRLQVKKSATLLEYSKTIFKGKKRQSIRKKNNNVKDSNSNNIPLIEKVRLSKKLSLPKKISPAEIVGNEDNLMSYIIKMISEPKDRKNLRAVSRRFYNLCNAKKNYISFVKHLKKEPPSNNLMYREEIYKYEPLIHIHKDSLMLSLPNFLSTTTEYLKKHKDIIAMNKYKITKLEIESINGHYVRFFENLNCFDCVEVVTFNPLHRLSINFRIFSKCSNLKPKTLKFMSRGKSSIVKPTERLDIIPKLIPDSVKCIYLHCTPQEIKWIFKIAKYIPERRFETLVLSQNYLTNLVNLTDARENMIQLTKCFKNVKFCLDLTMSYGVIRYFESNSWLFNVAEGTNVIYYTKISLFKNPSIRYQSSTDEVVPEHFENKYGLSKFEYFCMTTNDTWLNPPPLYRNPFIFLVEMMENLVTLEISMRTFSTPHEVEMFFRIITCRLENIKITNCEKLKKKSIKTLADRCKCIRNISLEGLNSKVISIKTIIEFFKNLKGLSIFYPSNKKVVKAFADFVGSKSIPNNRITKWPEIDFLHIVFSEPTSKDRYILKKIDMDTPRRCGRFIVKYHRKSRYNPVKFSEIIIHKSSNFYSDFIKLFTQPCWIKN
uniref:F-box domain-containing protein n=1 Tax=Strongyloides stercoralis TaxID=6248 RepID=A0A0K0ET57_STRER